MKKVLIAVVILSILVFACGAVGIVVYAKSTESKKALKVNINLFTELKNIDSYTVEQESAGNGRFNLTVLGQTIDEDQPLDSTSTIKVDVKNNKVSLNGQSGATEGIDITEYRDTDIFGNKELWKGIPDNKNLKIEDVTEDGRKMWKYTLKDAALNDLLVKGAQSSFETGFNSEAGAGQSLQNVTVDFDGQFEIVMFIDKSTNLLSKLSYSTPDDLVISFDISSPEFSAEGTATISDLKESGKFKDIKLKDGYKIPTNAILLQLK